MKTYTQLRTLYGKLTKNSSADNLTYGDGLIDDGYRLLLGDEDWSFLEVNATKTMVAGTQYYNLAANMIKPKIISVVVGNIRYTPELITSEEEWNNINVYTSIESNVPLYYYLRGGQQGQITVGFWPIPSADNTIEYTYKRAVKPMTIANYTTGSIVSVANGGTAVVGTGTSWNVSMIGRFIQIAESGSANGGDGLWYEIADVPSTTSLTLLNPYLGTTIAAATAPYVIGSVPVLPDEYQLAPVYYAAGEYWDSEGNNEARATKNTNKFEKLRAELKDAYANKTANPVLSSSLYGQRFRNANNYPWAT